MHRKILRKNFVLYILLQIFLHSDDYDFHFFVIYEWINDTFVDAWKYLVSFTSLNYIIIMCHVRC